MKVTPLRKKILFATTEATPLVEHTNIADFNGLLPEQLSDEYETAVIMPFYPSISAKAVHAENTNITSIGIRLFRLSGISNIYL